MPRLPWFCKPNNHQAAAAGPTPGVTEQVAEAVGASVSGLLGEKRGGRSALVSRLLELIQVQSRELRGRAQQTLPHF